MIKKLIAIMAITAAFMVPSMGVAHADELDLSQDVGSCTLTVVRATYDPDTLQVYEFTAVQYICT